MNVLKIFSMAWRNLWRQKRRTILTLVSIVFGGSFAIFMTGMQDYTWVDFIDSTAKMGSGHITVQHPEYQDRPTLSRTVTSTDDKRAAVQADDEVAITVERTTGQAMLATASDSFGAFFIAYDPTEETPYTQIWTDGDCVPVAEEPTEDAVAACEAHDLEACGTDATCAWDYEKLLAGELFDAPDSDGIVLGRVLANNLEAEIGDRVVFTLTDRSGEIVSGMERLSGIITTGADSTDAAIVLLPIETVRSVVGYEANESTQVAIFLNNGRRTLTASERIDALIGDDAAVLTWDQMRPEIKTFIAMKKGGGAVMSIVVAILVAAGIFNTIFMSVMERTREFGIMTAIGYNARQLFMLVMAESIIFATLGLALCAALTAAWYPGLAETGLDMTAMYQSMGMTNIEVSGIGMDTVMPFGIFAENLVAIATAIVVACLLAGLYPAWRAGRVEPVESINLV